MYVHLSGKSSVAGTIVVITIRKNCMESDLLLVNKWGVSSETATYFPDYKMRYSDVSKGETAWWWDNTVMT